MAPPEPIRTVAAASAYLEGLINVEKQRSVSYTRFGLGAIDGLMQRLEEPHRGLRVVHVAGSKGKGSTALLTEALLRGVGMHVGTFTSPHLERWTERFRIDGAEVDDDLLAAAVDRLAPHVDAMREANPSEAPSWFDATTAAALLLFREAEVDCAILEVGLGGRLDSTNVVTPRVTCITAIELEHTQLLGDTTGAIAGEKAGILKPGVPAVVGALDADAMAVVETRAAEVHAPLVRLGRDFHVEVLERSADGLQLRLRDDPLVVELRLPVLGEHQAGNAALALACARRVRDTDDPPLADSAACSLAGATLPGRLELLRRAPWILVDSAHTARSAAELARVIRGLPHHRTRLVLSISEGKDADSILAHLLPLADEVTMTRAEPLRSLAPDDVARTARAAAPDLDVRVVPNPHLALRAAAEGLAADDLLCVAGSIYLAGIGRRVLRDADPAARVAVTRR